MRSDCRGRRPRPWKADYRSRRARAHWWRRSRLRWDWMSQNQGCWGIRSCAGLLFARLLLPRDYATPRSRPPICPPRNRRSSELSSSGRSMVAQCPQRGRNTARAPPMRSASSRAIDGVATESSSPFMISVGQRMRWWFAALASASASHVLA